MCNLFPFLQLTPGSLSPDKEVEFVFNDVRKGGPQMDGKKNKAAAPAKKCVSIYIANYWWSYLFPSIFYFVLTMYGDWE